MSEFVEFGTKATADSVREQFEEYLCPVDDDRRLKTVAFVSDTPEGVLQQAEAQATESRAEDRQRGQMSGPLSEATREKIKDYDGFSKTNTTLSWRRAKGVFEREGHGGRFFESISALADYDDPKEGAEAEIRARREGAAKHGTNSISGEMNLGEEDIKEDRRRADAARTVQSEGCNHARDHCEHGDPEACEFLTEACGYDEGEVERILSRDDRHEEADSTEQRELVTVGGGDFPEMEVTPEVAGALSRSWQGYKAAISRLDRELSDVREAVINGRQAVAAINAIRSDHGQADLHADRLHDLLEALQSMPGDIPEIRTLEHFTEGDVIEQNDQQTLEGDRADDQARFVGGETGTVESQVERAPKQNPGGLEADQREQTASSSDTKQSRPDAFRVAEGGQETL